MIILVGASASGKTEVAKLLTKMYHINKVVTHTTRPIRVNEKNHVDYHFVSKEEFLALKAKGAFIETTIYNDNYYGTSKKEIADDKLLIVDPNGLHAFLEIKDAKFVTFLLEAKEDTRLKRMLSRGDKKENAMKRIENDRISFDINAIGKTDYYINSESLSLEEMTVEIFKTYLKHLHQAVKL